MDRLDHEPLFRQESSFFWAFGVKEPDCYGAIEVETGKSILFVPRVPDEYRIWMGELLTPERAAAMYAVDEAFYADEIASVFEKMEVSTLYTLHGLNTDSGKVHPARTFVRLQAPGRSRVPITALIVCANSDHACSVNSRVARAEVHDQRFKPVAGYDRHPRHQDRG